MLHIWAMTHPGCAIKLKSWYVLKLAVELQQREDLTFKLKNSPRLWKEMHLKNSFQGSLENFGGIFCCCYGGFLHYNTACI